MSSSSSSLLLRDLSAHGKVLATGADRVRFLNGLFTNDVARLAPGQGCRAAMLTVKGRLVGMALIYCDAEALFLDLDEEVAARVLENLERHLIVDDVTLDDRGAALEEVAVLGEGAAARLGALLSVDAGSLPSERYAHVTVSGPDLRVVAVHELGQAGFRVIGEGARALAARLEAEGARWLGDEEAELLRVEAGEPRFGLDMGEEVLPLEAGLDDAVSTNKGCYMGQEVIARVTARGHINKRLVGLRLEGERPAERGTKLSAPSRAEAGYVTSSVRSPRHGTIALGYVHRTLWAPGTEVELQEPAGPRKAVVSELPFR